MIKINNPKQISLSINHPLKTRADYVECGDLKSDLFSQEPLVNVTDKHDALKKLVNCCARPVTGMRV